MWGNQCSWKQYSTIADISTSEFPQPHAQWSTTGTIWAANPSGWMNAEIFESWLDHFIKHSHSAKDNPTLLIINNHVSHVLLAVIAKAKENGVVLLTFPPHTSHTLQPLDITVYGPLKKYFHTACNDWMLSNPGKLITIYEVAQCLSKSYPRALKPENI